MKYKITIKMDVDDIQELEQLLDKYDMEYEIEEVE